MSNETTDTTPIGTERQTRTQLREETQHIIQILKENKEDARTVDLMHVHEIINTWVSFVSSRGHDSNGDRRRNNRRGHADTGGNGSNENEAIMLVRELLMLMEDNFDRMMVGDTTANKSLTPTDVSYNLILNMYAKIGAGEEAQELLESMMSRYDRFAGGKGSPPAPTTRSFNTVMNAWAKSSHPNRGFKCEELFALMERWSEDAQQRQHREQAKPNTRTMCAVVDAWATLGTQNAAGRAVSILETVLERRRGQLRNGTAETDYTIHPTAILFNGVIKAFGRTNSVGGAESAENILFNFEAISDSGEFNTVGSTSLRSIGGTNSGAIDDDDYDESEDSMAPTVYSYSQVIQAWANSEKAMKDGKSARRAEAILVRMMERYLDGFAVKPNNVALSTVISAYNSAQSTDPEAIDKADSLFYRMVALYNESGDEEVKPDLITANALLAAWSRSKRPDAMNRVVDLLEQLQSFGRPDIYSYNTVVGAFAQNGLADKAHELLKQMSTEADLPDPTVITYNNVLKAYSQISNGRYPTPESGELIQTATDRAEAILQEMIERGITPNRTTYTSLISVWAKAVGIVGKWRRPHEILQQMIDRYEKDRKEHDKPDNIVFTAVLSACVNETGSSKGKREALMTAIRLFEMYKTHPEYGRPNEVTYLTMLRACVNLSANKAEQYRLMRSILTECCSVGLLSTSIVRYFGSNVPPRMRDEMLPTPLPRNWSMHVHPQKRPQ